MSDDTGIHVLIGPTLEESHKRDVRISTWLLGGMMRRVNAAVAVLGKTGMLGNMLCRTFEEEAICFDRSMIDAADPDIRQLDHFDWVINCIGLIKPYCDDVVQAMRVNALFPHSLPKNTIQIATDCVYSGRQGKYVETDPHDAMDVYGKTKSLGEALHIKNLRCSIIGPEIKNHTSLLDWLLSQKGEVQGFINHWWNGITTYHFSKIVKGVVRERIELPNLQHIVPADLVTKAELLRIIAKAYGKDISIIEIEAPDRIDRTLSTTNLELNQRLWKSAGYEAPPSIENMVGELAALPDKPLN